MAKATKTINQIISTARAMEPTIKLDRCYNDEVQRLFEEALALKCDVAMDYVAGKFQEGACTQLPLTVNRNPEAWRTLREMGYTPEEIDSPATDLCTSTSPPQVMARWGAHHGWALGDATLADVVIACGLRALEVLRSGSAAELSFVLDAGWEEGNRDIENPFYGITHVPEVTEEWECLHVTCSSRTAIWAKRDGEITHWRVLHGEYPDENGGIGSSFEGFQLRPPHIAAHLFQLDEWGWDVRIEIGPSGLIRLDWVGLEFYEAEEPYEVCRNYHIWPILRGAVDFDQLEEAPIYHLGGIEAEIVEDPEVIYWERRLNA